MAHEWITDPSEHVDRKTAPVIRDPDRYCVVCPLCFDPHTIVREIYGVLNKVTQPVNNFGFAQHCWLAKRFALRVVDRLAAIGMGFGGLGYDGG